MFSLATIAEHIDARVQGNPNTQVSGIAPLQTAQSGDISFLDNAKYRRYLTHTRAAAVIVSADDALACETDALIVAEPYVAFAKAAQLFVNKTTVNAGIHATAVIGQHCEVHPSASIGPYVVLGNDCVIAEHAVIGAHTSLGDAVRIGKNTKLHAGVKLYTGTTLGESVEVHSGAVIGADGFGLASENGRWLHVPQLGGVVIGNHVSIGANTTIDRGTLGDTCIHNGVKLDNQIQIAHNVEIGENTAIAACVGISGSTKIGKQCILAGGVGVAGHLQITDNVTITAMTGVSRSIDEAGVYSSGLPAQPNSQWRRNTVTLRRIEQWVKKVKRLEQQCEAVSS